MFVMKIILFNKGFVLNSISNTIHVMDFGSKHFIGMKNKQRKDGNANSNVIFRIIDQCKDIRHHSPHDTRTIIVQSV